MENTNEIRVKMNGGFLVARRNSDSDYDGVTITFETDDKEDIDVVRVECKSETNKKKIDVYCYEDITEEDFTKKYVLDSEEICKILS